MESGASSLSQTIYGLWLDHARRKSSDIRVGGRGLLRAFLTLNVLQLACAVALWRFNDWKKQQAAVQGGYIAVSTFNRERVFDELDSEMLSVTDKPQVIEVKTAIATSDEERSRSKVFFICCIVFVGIVWVVFLGVAWRDLA